MRSILKYILYLCVILFSTLQSYAFQETFRSLSISDGMTDLVVNSIYKDSHGFIWFGTNSSLEKFDGVRLKKYDIGEPDGKNKRVYEIIESPALGVICATDEGICRMDTLTDRFIPLYREHISCKVNSLLSYSPDTLIVAADNGLYVCTPNGIHRSLLGYQAISAAERLTGIAVSEDSSSVWIASVNGLIWYKPSTGEYRKFECEEPALSNSFYNIVAVDDYIYLGTMDRGLMRFSITDHIFGSYVDVGCSVISSLSSDGGDLLYVGTDGNGVHFLSLKDEKILKSYRHIQGRKDGIRSNSVYSVLVDRDGLLWIGLYQIGVDYTQYQSSLFGIYRWKDKFSTKDMPVRTIAFNGRQRLIGSRDGLVFVDEDRDIVRLFNMPLLRSNMIISSCYFGGKFYVGTYGGGMYVLDPETLSVTGFPDNPKEPFLSGHIFSIRPDDDGRLWIGTSSGLFCFHEGRQVYHFASSHSKIPEGNVYEIFFDSTGKGWICTETGVCLWESPSGAIKNNIFPNGYINRDKIRAVYETSSGELYFLPEKGRVFRSDVRMHGATYADDIPILEDKQILSVLEDGMGGMFVTTNNGLYRIDSCMNVIPYNLTDGIPDPIFTNCTSLRDSAGTCWFGNSRGLVYLDKHGADGLRRHPYRLEITDVRVNGKTPAKPVMKEGTDVYRLELGGQENSLKIMFSGLVYSDPAYMIYEYSLNESGRWIPLHGVPEISLFDVKDDIVLKIRRAGYPESQITLYIDVESSYVLFVYFAVALMLCIIVVYVVRRRMKHMAVMERVNPEPYLLHPTHNEEEQADINPVQYGSMPGMVVGSDPEDFSADESEIHSEEQSEIQLEAGEDKYRNYKLSDEECKRIVKVLNREMTKNKLYRNQSLKIADLASIAGTSSHALSYVFNQYLQKTYYDYINEYRVEEFKSSIKKDKYSKYTLEALSEHCGFSSRASFFRSFKKVTGITPNEYIKNIKAAGKD